MYHKNFHRIIMPMNTLGNIKDPEQIADSLKENPEKIKVLK